MVELTRTNEPVLLSWLLVELAAAGITPVVLDLHTSALEGSISAIPRRVMVTEDDLPRAQRLLAMAEEIGKGKIRGFDD
jgi:hypothetical protein